MCREIEANPVAALTIWWPEMDRQVRIEGRLERTSAAESDAYWATRPRASQVSAVVSPQSELIRGKEELLAAAADLERRMAGGEIPRPSTWGGMRLIPDVMEFWQEGPHRLHDRIRYRRRNDQWIADRLAP
jgi:pyridoxamine 5'-phosphate oxidase